MATCRGNKLRIVASVFIDLATSYIVLRDALRFEPGCRLASFEAIRMPNFPAGVQDTFLDVSVTYAIEIEYVR
jgi:hypothetical protein